MGSCVRRRAVMLVQRLVMPSWQVQSMKSTQSLKTIAAHAPCAMLCVDMQYVQCIAVLYHKQLIGLTLLHPTYCPPLPPPPPALLSNHHTVLHTPLGALSFSDARFVDLGTKSQTSEIPSTHSPPATKAATSSLKCRVR